MQYVLYPNNTSKHSTNGQADDQQKKTLSHIPRKETKGKEHNRFEESQDLNQAAKLVLEAHEMIDQELGFFVTWGDRSHVGLSAGKQ